MDRSESRTRFSEAHVACLATASADGAPHLVPVVFAVAGDTVFTAIDTKRKSTQRLRRLANIEQNPRVSLLVDHYDADWSQLWWVRADGLAEIHHRGEQMARCFDLLRRKYPQYQRVSLTGPVVTITVTRWTSWSA